MKIVKNNVINKEATRLFQSETLKGLAESIITSAGPQGSGTKIILHLANDPESPNRNVPIVKYSKDGHSILSYISHCDNGMLCNSVCNDVYEMTTYVKKKIGDNSTATVCMASRIFDNLVKVETDTKLPPREIIKQFKKAVEMITVRVKEKTQEFTPEEAYNIAYISSNGDEEVANNIKQIYEEFGKEVYIDIGISNDEQHKMKIMDGMSISTGYNSPAYRNDLQKNIASIPKPRIYYFQNMIDTPAQIALLAAIVVKNITDPYRTNKLENVIPTVILAPQLANDAIVELNEVIRLMQMYDKPEHIKNKPPLLIVTGIFEDEATDDIARLCGCPPIRKYQSLEQLEKDKESGKAPTTETIVDNWYGSADVVVADAVSTKFINPLLKYTTKGEERKRVCEQNKEKFVPAEDDNEEIFSAHYNSLVTALEAQLELEINNNATMDITGSLTRRINSLKAKVVEYQVGGIAIADRDSLKDSVWDAIRNCRSAAKSGVGLACNMEGYFACLEILNNTKADDDSTVIKFVEMIHDSYVEYISSLYEFTFGIDKDECLRLLETNSRTNGIVDLSQGYDKETVDKVIYNTKIKSSINADIVTLEALSKILSLMMTCAQTLIPEPLLDSYTAFVDNRKIQDKLVKTCRL